MKPLRNLTVAEVIAILQKMPPDKPVVQAVGEDLPGGSVVCFPYDYLAQRGL